MEELDAGQKPGGAEERAPCLPISPTVPSLSPPACLPSQDLPLLPVFMHVVLLPSALTLLSLSCLSAFPMLPAPCMTRVAAVAAKTLCEPLCGDSITWQRETDKGIPAERRIGMVKGDE